MKTSWNFETTCGVRVVVYLSTDSPIQPVIDLFAFGGFLVLVFPRPDIVQRSKETLGCVRHEVGRQGVLALVLAVCPSWGGKTWQLFYKPQTLACSVMCAGPELLKSISKKTFNIDHISIF